MMRKKILTIFSFLVISRYVLTGVAGLKTKVTSMSQYRTRLAAPKLFQKNFIDQNIRLRAVGNLRSEASRSSKQLTKEPTSLPKKQNESLLLKEPLWNGLPAKSLSVLLLIFISNQWSRALVYYINNFSPPTELSLTEASRLYANIDIGFDQTQYSILASLGFTVSFALCSLAAGDIVGRYDRGLITAIAAMGWSTAVGLGSLSQNYVQLLLSRIAMGLAQGLTTPAAYTLLADITPAASIATANAIFSSGIYLGGGLASLSILLDQSIGWRGAGISVGAFGFLAAAVALLVIKDPRGVSSNRDEDNTRDVISLGEALKSMGQSKPTKLLLAASLTRLMAGFTIATWKAPLFLSKFPTETSNFGLQNAVIVTLAGGTSGILGGALADRLARLSDEPKDNIDGKNFIDSLNAIQARLLVPTVGTILAFPLWALVAISPTFQTAIIALLIEYAVAECWYGPTLAGLYATLPDPRLRASTQGIFSLVTALANLAPILVGELLSPSGFLGWGKGTQIQQALLYSVSIEYALSALLFGLALVELGKRQDQ